MTIEDQLKESAQEIDQALDDLLPPAAERACPEIVCAMRYSLLGPGKRIRAFLTRTIGNIFGSDKSNTTIAACIVEIVHCYSLIHDDLPALDNDDWRRGKPSSHKMFGEATAILTGNALLTLAFEVITHEKLIASAADKIAILQVVSHNAGYKSLIYGQILDLNCKHQEADAAQIIKIHAWKTASMFEASCIIGGIMGKIKPTISQQSAIREFAKNFGLLFQLMDDWQDSEQEEESNLVRLIGLDEAQKMADILLKRGMEALLQLPATHSRTALQDLLCSIHKAK